MSQNKAVPNRCASQHASAYNPGNIVLRPTGRKIVKLVFLGKETVNGGSPTLFATDRGTYVVQGWRVPNEELRVEIPSMLLAFLEEGTRLASSLEDTGRGSYVLSGAAIDDPEALAQMDIPGHETAVEVGKVRREDPNLLKGEDFNQLFRDFKRSAFHLEMRDEYSVTEEIEPIRKWRNNESDDYEWVREWHQLIKAATSAGKLVVRARVVTEPVTEYVRFEHAMARFNVAAGEELYWVPRSLTTDLTFPEHDFWFFDDEVVAFNVFAEDGSSFGARLTRESAIVEQCAQLRDQLVSVGIPHERYILR